MTVCMMQKSEDLEMCLYSTKFFEGTGEDGKWYVLSLYKLYFLKEHCWGKVLYWSRESQCCKQCAKLKDKACSHLFVEEFSGP